MGVEADYDFGDVRMCDIIADRAFIPYQRDLNAKKVAEIVRDFDPKLLDPLVLNIREDGRYYLIRGQHRRAAIIVKFGQYATARCRIYCGLTPQEEAEIFALEDRLRRKHKPAERWNASLEAGLSPYVEINAIIESEGWTVDPKSTKPHGQIRTVGPLLASYASHGPGNLRSMLALLRDVWGTEEIPKEATLGGVALFVSMYENETMWDRSRVVSIMQKLGQDVLISKAKLRQQTDHCTPPVAIAKTLEIEFNTHLSQAKRLPSFDALRTRRARGGKKAE